MVWILDVVVCSVAAFGLFLVAVGAWNKRGAWLNWIRDFIGLSLGTCGLLLISAGVWIATSAGRYEIDRAFWDVLKKALK